MLSNGDIGAVCSSHLAECNLLTCDNAGAGDWQPVGLLVAMVTTVGACYPQQLPQTECRDWLVQPDGFGSFS